jgi:lysylphosphatidylglycerol synthetase-like protein (DUF2156 family)
MIFQFIPVAEASVLTVVKTITRVIVNPFIILLFALATVYFLAGLVKYLLQPDSKEVHEQSKDQMLYGIMGMFIMVAVFGIMRIYLTTINEKQIQIDPDGAYKVEVMLD